MFIKKSKLTVENPIVGAFKVSPNDRIYGKNGVLVMNHVEADTYCFGIEEERIFTILSFTWIQGQPVSREAMQEAILTIQYSNQDQTQIILLCTLHLGQLLLSKVINKKTDISSMHPQQEVDQFAKIKQLKELLDMGAITQQEYDEKKKQLLDLI